MKESTWLNINYGLHQAIHDSIKNKSIKSREKPEVLEIINNRDIFCLKTISEFKHNTYKIGNYRHFKLLDKKKIRDISVLPFKDRCVLNSIKNAILPIILGYMTDDMLGGLPKKGVLAKIPNNSVLKRIKKCMANPNLKYYIKCDITKFYDNVNKVIAIRMIELKITHKKTLAIIKQHLFKLKKLAIGDPFSHLIANMVMSKLIRNVKYLFPKIKMINFADDLIVFSSSKEELVQVRKYLRKLARLQLRMHYKPIYIRSIKEPFTFCGYRFIDNYVRLNSITKKRYIKARHKKQSMASYNGLLKNINSVRLRYLVEKKDNIHMSDKIRRPFAGKNIKINALTGIIHTIVNVEERESKRDTGTYMHILAIAEGLGLIVYCTSAGKIMQYLKSNKELPIRNVKIVKDWSGYYYEGTVYTDEEEEQIIREQFNIK